MQVSCNTCFCLACRQHYHHRHHHHYHFMSCSHKRWNKQLNRQHTQENMSQNYCWKIKIHAEFSMSVDINSTDLSWVNCFISGSMAHDVMQPRTLIGSASNSGPIERTTSSGTNVDTAPASWVRPPTVSWTRVRGGACVATKQPKNAPNVLYSAQANSSWSVSTS